MLSITREKSRNTNIESPTHVLLYTANGKMASNLQNHEAKLQNWAHVVNIFMYGIINSVTTIPFLYGYAVIVFSHKDFADFMPALTKLIIFSSAVHQIMFTLTSSLPCAIGQAQDAGLILLSTMVTSVCNSLGDDVPLEAKVATSIVGIGIATALLGVCLVIMGKLKLAALVAYLPVPVIGGYLAYIGIFCLYAGLALCTGLVVNDIKSMIGVFNNAHDVLHCVPGVVGGVFLRVISQRYNNSLILSGAILIMPVVFFFILLVGGISMDDARNGGWIHLGQEPATVSEMIGLFDFSLVHWNQLPKQFGTWIVMVLIVAFSSCIDVAAIELETGKKLKYNYELMTVGWSNVVSGLLGGYPGSYIFSQTIFTYHSKTNSRIVGVCLLVSEIALVLAPVSVMSYVPRFVFAAVVIFIAIALMIQWLVLSYQKLSLREYAVLWMTFIAVNVLSLDQGMLIGVGIAIVNFLLGYIHLPVVNRKPRSSGMFRTLEERRLLNEKCDTIAYFEFNGFLFFGSSVQILDRVQKAVYVRRQLSSDMDDVETNYVNAANLPLTPREHPAPLIRCLDGTPATHPDAVPTNYVVMDFTNVTAMDTTAARSAFLILQKYCSNHDITVVYAAALPHIRSTLVKNNVVGSDSFFPSTESALDFCENQILAGATGVRRKSSFHDECSRQLTQFFAGESDDSQILSNIDEFFKKREVPAGHEFYSVGESSDRFYFLASGCVTLSKSNGLEESASIVMPGSLFGEVDFFSHQQRQLMAFAMKPCTVLEMRRGTYELMQEQHPVLLTRIRDVVIQSMAVSLSNALKYSSR
ncbi:unnamed protein product [Peronospora belbahrii]|uniref:STAS domain-containing protein n=1 Tax=Peronospora belbahrii TaxID=622444 RepID=A0AAU9KT00_9STRA|nr:unnamed protein product [Peronospora belbahrii]CAH0515437.1 unnamed protein product [Peronospora belbahrii]